eukprot:5753433-Pyramimonas_sp.AAC.1
MASRMRCATVSSTRCSRLPRKRPSSWMASRVCILVNVSGASGLGAVLAHSRIQRCHALAVQEQHALDTRCSGWEQELRGRGWRVAMTFCDV